jgi:quinol monooxygenase YgiN
MLGATVADRDEWSDPDGVASGTDRDRIWPDRRCTSGYGGFITALRRQPEEVQQMLVKVFPIKLKDGNQEKAEALVEAFAPKGPGLEDGTVSFRVYRDPKNVDYLLFVEHFIDQAAYDAHTGSSVYQEMIAGQFADLIVEFVEIDHELLVSI